MNRFKINFGKRLHRNLAGRIGTLMGYLQKDKHHTTCSKRVKDKKNTIPNCLRKLRISHLWDIKRYFDMRGIES
jgi:hypothetical protein